jgi:heme-degrading monooxygenase HmoA
MASITIDDTARFVSLLSFELNAGDVPAMAREVQHVVQQRGPRKKGFIGAIVMANAEQSHLLVVTVWESGHAWSAAQYDQEIGRVVSEVVEAARKYEIQTYETVTVVRA